ncbi:MAG: S8 family serine peptidase [Gammaproteobacteria bacterium]
MDQTVKIFCTGAEQDKIAEKHPVIERYDGFVITEIPKKEVTRLSRTYPVEDITELYTIQVGERTIDTSRPRLDAQGKIRAHPAYKGIKAPPPGRHHNLVQFIGPIKETWLRAVKKAGGEPRAPYGDFTYIVRADDETLAQIAALPFVRWTGHLPTKDRVAPSVLTNIGRKADDTSATLPRTRVMPGAYAIEFFGSADLTAGIPEIKKLGFKISGKDAKGKLLIVEAESRGAALGKKITALAAVHGVRSIRERSLKRTSNDVAAGVMGAATTMASSGLGLSGQGECVGVCDTGLDTGNPQTIHPDFTARIAWVKSYPITPDFAPYITNPGGNDGPADVDSGHGTHVAGSVLGSGAASIGLPGVTAPIRGLAHKAHLVFQAVEQEMKWKPPYQGRYDRYLLSGLPLDLTTLFTDAYKKGARIHSNSWGGGEPGVYDSSCEQLDRFVWGHKNFCILFAAGNDGSDSDGNGKINPMSVTSPGTAKNCITVGACENRRPAFNTETYGKWWPQDYPVAPLRNDPMADNPDQMAAFSSRGPTKDGRMKPDIVSPGTFILSTRSTQIAPNNRAWAAFPQSKLYFHMGGTSMATPLTAGAVALVREYLRKQKKMRSPSAALLKATLIAGAARLPGYAPAGTMLDYHQGYGRVNLDAILSPPAPASAVFLDIKPGLKTGNVHAIEIAVKSEKVPLHVTLAYTDYPGPTLVNNLNLIVTAPDGKRYVGNQAAGAVLAMDTKNNVEVVRIEKPGAGKWKIEIIGSNIPNGPQDFALVYVAHTGN